MLLMSPNQELRVEQFRPERGLHRSEAPSSRLRVPLRACQRCRSRHKRCDITTKRKTCSPCQKAGTSCRGGGSQSELQIRYSVLSLRAASSPSASRGAVTTPSAGSENEASTRKAFETPHGPNDAADISIPPEGPVGLLHQKDYESSVAQTTSRPLHQLSPHHVSPASNDHGSSSTPAASSGRSFVSFAGDSTSPEEIAEQPNTLARHRSVLRSIGTSPLQQTSRLLSRSHRGNGRLFTTPTATSWQLTTEQAQLVKHFLTYLLPWFDYLDPRAPFRSFIQATILQDQCTLYAVLAVSSRHLESISSALHDSDEYERKSLELLIPAIRDSCTYSEPIPDAVFVMAVMQRCLEEMTGPGDQSTIAHTVCAAVLLRMRSRVEEASNLVNAAMAVAMRQELYIANIIQRPMEIEGHYCGVDDSLDSAPDYMWALRITAHAVRVTNYAYGSAPQSAEKWDELWKYLDDWDRSKPASFNPLNEVEAGGHSQSSPSTSDSRRIHLGVGTFPEIYYMSDPPIAARQYLEICKILLLAHDPRSSSLGLGRTASLVAREETIRQSVRLIVGIALSNPEYMSARILAGLSVGMAGELFIEADEISRLLSIVTQAERHIGWPGLKVSQRLKDFWAVDYSDTR